MNSTVEPLHNGHLGGQKKAVVDLGRGQPPLFLDQNEARRAENIFLETPPPLTQGLDDRPPLESGLYGEVGV